MFLRGGDYFLKADMNMCMEHCAPSRGAKSKRGVKELKKRVLSILFALLLVLSFSLVPAVPASAASIPVTLYYGDITLPATYADFLQPGNWDLNAGPVTIRYTLNLVGAPNVANTGDYSQMGLVGLSSGGSGARMCGFLSDWNNPTVKFPTYPDNDASLDNDDKFNLQRFPNPGTWDEQMYNVNSVNTLPTLGLPGFNPWANYGIWFDRDGVDQWQDDMWGMVNGGTYNTLGVCPSNPQARFKMSEHLC